MQEINIMYINSWPVNWEGNLLFINDLPVIAAIQKTTYST